MRRLLLCLLLLAAAAPACGGDEDPEGSAGATTTTSLEPVVLDGDQVELQALDNSFDPQAAQVAVGTEVTWTNGGRNEHNVIPSDDEEAEWRIDTEEFQPGDSGSFTFTEAGTYRYYCSIHGTADTGMTGVLVVA